MATVAESLTYEPVALTFGTSGLRGLVTDMTDLECYINTLGFLTYLQQLAVKPTDIYIAGDLRQSTPRILAVVTKAVQDAGYNPVYCGLIPTPAVAFYALTKQSPCIMVTGSHIPANRNGIKFHKSDGEVLKSDEIDIKQAVTAVREAQYSLPTDESLFDDQGSLRQAVTMPDETSAARDAYHERHVSVFGGQAFAGKKIVFYQHSSVGRDQLVELLRALGAEVIPVGRSEKFIPIDTENVTVDNQKYFKQLAGEYPDAFAIVSTDGDADRPFVIDEHGMFHRGDEVGALVAKWLQADFAAYPISANDAVDTYLSEQNIEYAHTRIGSPYVVVAMDEAFAAGKQRVVGWEVNGGFLLGCDATVNGKNLPALPTRDAIFPIIVALRMAVEAGRAVSDIFTDLPQRYTDAGLLDNFPAAVSKKILAKFSDDSESVRTELETYFSTNKGFGAVKSINTVDGIRLFFDNGDIAHLRPSGNAPQLRIYSVADSAERAAEIVAMALAEPDGIFRKIEQNI